MDGSQPVNDALREVVLPSQTDACQQIQSEILEAVAKHEWDEHAVFGIRLALEEALVNAIKHGNRMDPDKQLIVRYAADDKHVVIEVEDQGPGFEPGDVPDPTLPENLENPSGRGLMLMGVYMDTVEHVSRGNCVRMIKSR